MGKSKFVAPPNPFITCMDRARRYCLRVKNQRRPIRPSSPNTSYYCCCFCSAMKPPRDRGYWDTGINGRNKLLAPRPSTVTGVRRIRPPIDRRSFFSRARARAHVYCPRFFISRVSPSTLYIGEDKTGLFFFFTSRYVYIL